MPLIAGFYREKEFQETEIGKIPKEWEIVKIKDLLEFQRGFSYRKRDISESPTYIKFITIDNLEKEGGKKKDSKILYLKDALEIEARFFVNKGDLLIANTDMSKGFIIGAPLYIDNFFVTNEREKLVFSMDLTKITPKRAIDTKFFFYFFTWNKIRQVMRSFAQGTNVLHLNHDLVKDLQIPFPPLKEQWGIAEVLSTTDRAIEETERLIEKLEKLKKALMQELLTKGIGHRESQETEIGKIPREWRIVRLGDKGVARIRGIKRPSWFDKVAFITMDLIPDNAIFASYEIRDIKHVRSYVYCEAGDLLLPKITPCFENGKQGIVPPNVPNRFAFATTEVFPIVCEGIDGLFLFYILKLNKFRKVLEFSMRGTTGRQRIPKEVVERLKIPLPSLPEQQKIAEVLLTVDRWIELEEMRREKLERVKRGLMELLLSGKIRVRVHHEPSS
ncbi:restriction endonuclease subunit S [Candidatus Nitrosocaldus islandicus]|uniref:restriction endonuclease subunit S n=1 Tax=Candidatus Nitrosocaldus islandicus TaxID=2045011 RepID=UPI000CD2B38E|nr:restriction endonuclease subunit S [Candidatus Nitrosocaldus islandicus]